MFFSIVVTTKDRPEVCSRFLKSLHQQRFSDFEVILGEQAQGPGSELLASAFKGLTGKHLILAPCGLSSARNQLLPHTGGEWLLLGDDDCVYDPEFLFLLHREIHTNREREKALICTGKAGRVMARLGVFRNAPSYALALHRRTLLTIGPFDEHMGVGADYPWQSGEETDILLRFQIDGHDVRSCPVPAPLHPAPLPCPPERLPALVKKTRGYGMGRMYLIRKHRLGLLMALLNIAYPLALLPLAALRHGRSGLAYSWAMFTGRVQGYFESKKYFP